MEEEVGEECSVWDRVWAEAWGCESERPISSVALPGWSIYHSLPSPCFHRLLPPPTFRRPPVSSTYLQAHLSVWGPAVSGGGLWDWKGARGLLSRSLPDTGTPFLRPDDPD